MIVSTDGVVIRVKVKDISKLGRSTQGVKVMSVGDSDSVCALARMRAAKDEPDQNAANAESAASNEDDKVDIGDEGMDESLIDE